MNSLLLPQRYHLIGWIFLLIFLPLGLGVLFWEVEFDFFNLYFPWREGGGIFDLPKTENLTNEIAALGVLLGLVFICLARTKNEDEFIGLLRLKSWHTAIIVYAVVLGLTIVFIYGIEFFRVLVICIYLPFVFFYIRFRWFLMRLKKSMKHEE
nr:hypothetical protein [Saprospiraceae bacterium]